MKYGILRDEAAGTPEGGGTAPKAEPVKAATIKLDDEEVDLAELKSARSLFNALRDPETGTEIIKTLAERAGILNSKGEPKGSEKNVEAALEGISKKFLREALGKDFEQFSDKVGPVFDKIVQHYLEEKFGQLEVGATQKTWEKSVDEFIESHQLTPKLEDKMKEIMEEAPPNVKGKSFNAKSYLARVYKNACEELGVKEESKTKKAPGVDIPDFVVRKSKDKISTADAVELAMKGILVRRED